MRTTLDLDDDLVRTLLARHPEMTKTEALETAVAYYLAHDATDRLRAIAGTVEIGDVSTKLRKRDRRA